MHKLIVYGGAFNPPHAGHVDVMRQLGELGARVLVVPSYRHAFGKTMAPFALRAAWLEKIACRLREEGIVVEVDTCEQRIGEGNERPVYSWDVLSFIATREGVGTGEIGFVIGEDNAPCLDSFYRGEELRSQFSLVVAKERIVLHSTNIRNAICNGQAPAAQWLAPGLSEQDYDYYQVCGE